MDFNKKELLKMLIEKSSLTFPDLLNKTLSKGVAVRKFRKIRSNEEVSQPQVPQFNASNYITEKEAIENHIKIVEKARARVVEAKDWKFMPFSSPKKLREKLSENKISIGIILKFLTL